MLFFGPKAPCAHCGKNVRKPRNSDQFLCKHCGQPGPWATAEQIRGWTQTRDARERYSELLKQITAGGEDGKLAPALREMAVLTGYNQAQLQETALRAFHDFAQRALEHDILTKEDDDMELTRFRGHLTIWVGGLHDAQEVSTPTAIPA